MTERAPYFPYPPGMCQDCGRWGGSNARHVCYFVTPQEREAAERRRGREFRILHAWNDAINADARRDVELEFPDPE